MPPFARAWHNAWLHHVWALVYQWGRWRFRAYVTGLVLGISVLSALLVMASGLEQAIDGRQLAEMPLQQLPQLAITLSAYSLLFFLMNMATVVVYVLSTGAVVHWAGTQGYLPALDYAHACRLAFASGMLPLAVLLLAVVMWDMFTLQVLLCMAVHGGILAYIAPHLARHTAPATATANQADSDGNDRIA